LPLASVRTMQEVYDKSVARTSFTLVMLGIAGAMALALGIIGIYGVMSYTVSQRKREIGIRLALGAQAGDVLQMVLRQGTKLALAGMVIGLIAAAEPTLRHQVLPDRQGIALAAQTQFDRLTERFAETGGPSRLPFFRFRGAQLHAKPGGHLILIGRFCGLCFCFSLLGLPAPSGVRVPFRTN
jgi:hypothetical protein